MVVAFLNKKAGKFLTGIGAVIISYVTGEHLNQYM